MFLTVLDCSESLVDCLLAVFSNYDTFVSDNTGKKKKKERKKSLHVHINHCEQNTS